MTPKDIFLHLRFPFSLFLMPVYWFALSQTPQIDTPKAIWVFIIWHLLVYPASNAYNSYFDKDEGSIGGLEKPPMVDKKLFNTAWIFDLIALFLAFFIVNKTFALAVLLYGMMSKAYSHSSIRLKKYPIASWLIVGFFQGFWVYLATQHAVNGVWQRNSIFPALLSSMMLWAVYPMTQIYQHQEDAKRGDNTLSILLGKQGTFAFTASIFTLAFIGFYFYLPFQQFLLFTLFTLPTTLFFLNWWRKSWKNEHEINFKNTMWLNALASLGLNGFYVLLMLLKH